MTKSPLGIIKRSRVSPRVAVGAGLGALSAGGMIAGHLLGLGIADLGSLPEKIRALGPVGWLAFAAAEMLVALVGIVPASLLGIAAGATYGIATGFLLSAAGTLTGGWLAFKLSRSLLRDWIAARMARSAHHARLDAAIGRDGWRLVCLLRISPVMPFAVTSYALGLTSVSSRAYIVGTLASLPALFGYVLAGALTGMTLTAPLTGPWAAAWRVLLGVGIVATVVLTLRLGWLLRATGVLTAESRSAGAA